MLSHVTVYIRLSAQGTLLSAVPVAVFTTGTASVPHASVIGGGLDATAHSFIVITYITVLGMVNAWDQTSASARRDFLVEGAPIPIAPSFSVVRLVPRTQRAAGAIA